MTEIADPTLPMRERAAAYPEVDQGTSCNQSSFKAQGRSFLFIGPGAKGVGFKAMFKLKASMTEAQALAQEHPKRFEVGKTGWVTARFSAEEPMEADRWQRWLDESYRISTRAI